MMSLSRVGPPGSGTHSRTLSVMMQQVPVGHTSSTKKTHTPLAPAQAQLLSFSIIVTRSRRSRVAKWRRTSHRAHARTRRYHAMELSGRLFLPEVLMLPPLRLRNKEDMVLVGLRDSRSSSCPYSLRLLLVCFKEGTDTTDAHGRTNQH